MTMDWLWSTVLAVHLLGAIMLVGSLFYALIVLRPALAILEPAPRLQLDMNTLKRFFVLVRIAMPMMLITGWAMVYHVWRGMAGLPWYVNAMQGMALIMVGVFVFTFLAPLQRLFRAIRPGPEILPRIRLLLTANLALGLITAAVAAFGQSLG